MSLHPEDPTAPPEETRRVARAAFPKGTLCLDIAGALGPIYQDSQFAGLFPPLGQPAAAPAMLALATVLKIPGGLFRSSGRRCRPGPDRLEVCVTTAPDRPWVRPHRAERVPLPADRGQGRAADA